MSMITVECSDLTLITIDKEMAMSMSGVLRKQLESNPTQDSSAPMTLENISSNTLLKVLEFCEMHTSRRYTPATLKAWDEKFVRLEPSELCELASAAYYLEIRPLVDLTCKAIAKLLKGKSPAEIRRTFNILYDFTPGDDVPPPTIRDKLRTKLHNKRKDVRQNRDDASVDTRSVDDLVSFIAGSDIDSKSKKTKQKSKKGKKKPNSEQTKKEKSKDVPQDDQRASTLPTTNDSAHKNFDFLLSEESNNETNSEDEELDPELKAAQDREVEEFRRRLESIQRCEVRPKVAIPSLGLLVSNCQLGKD